MTTKGKSLERTNKPEKTPSRDAAVSQRPANATPQAVSGLLDVQRAVGNLAIQRMLRTGAIQTRQDTSQPVDQHEREAQQFGEYVTCRDASERPNLSRTGLAIQRSPANESAISTPTTATPTTTTTPTPTPTASAPTPSPAAPSLIVDDSVTDLAPGQMRKSEFLSQLRSAVCQTADEALAGTIWSTVGCPYIARWFEYYGNKNSRHIERAIRKYAPETAKVTTAGAYIPLICARVRWGISVWVETGRVTGVPEGMSAALPGAGSGEGTEEGAGGTLAGMVGAGARLMRGIFFKGRDGGAREGDDPQAIQAQLGPGRGINGGVRSRMESAFGMGFGQVHVHTDAMAAELASGLNARAFTIGGDIAFARGEYQPGTLIGDALIAHELAHTMQQSGGNTNLQSQGKGNEVSGAFEEEADRSAVSAVLSMWPEVKESLHGPTAHVLPRLRSGLRLQACTSEHQKEVKRLAKVQHGFLKKKAKEKEEEEKKAAIEAQKKAGVKNPRLPAPKVTTGEVLKEEVKKRAFATHPAHKWLSLSPAAQAKWHLRASAAWSKVLTSVKGTELEKGVKALTFRFAPEEALTKRLFASVKGKRLSVGMPFVKLVEEDPKNVWETLAHEIAHIEYGKTLSEEVMWEVLKLMPKTERKKWEKKEDYQRFYEAYSYPETEIFANLRGLRYREPVSGPKPKAGGVHPYVQIPRQLKKIKEAFHPEVAKAVLKVLKKRVAGSTEILARDKKYFLDQVKKIFGYTL